MFKLKFYVFPFSVLSLMGLWITPGLLMCGKKYSPSPPYLLPSLKKTPHHFTKNPFYLLGSLSLIEHLLTEVLIYNRTLLQVGLHLRSQKMDTIY